MKYENKYFYSYVENWQHKSWSWLEIISTVYSNKSKQTRRICRIDTDIDFLKCKVSVTA